MTQRRQYGHLKNGRSSTLTDSRIALMDALGFVWILRQDAGIIWRKRYNMLCEYRNIYGDCLVPQRYKLNPQLGTWVSTQRRQYKLFKEGKSSSMKLQRIHCLNSIGFMWASAMHDSKTSETVEKSFEMAYKKSKRWKETIKKMNGLVVVKSNDCTSIVSDRESYHSENAINNKFFIGQQLMTTQNMKRPTHVDVISSMWKNAADSMPSNVKIKIDEDSRHVTNLPPMTSKITKDNLQWDICFNELVAYKASHGDCCALSCDIPALARWVKTQRMQYQLLGQKELSSLTPTRISRLEGIGFNWAIKDGLDKRGWLQAGPLIQYRRNKFVNSSALGTKKDILVKEMKNQENSITKIPLKPDKGSSTSFMSMSNSINLLYANYVKNK
mmetsp:Transcript_55169/g.64545  ORF Transcript_55169/g.64545 Transcript_55169/m.64545 type:complete len:385 (+) Transcript_55169:289-1443(+)